MREHYDDEDRGRHPRHRGGRGEFGGDRARDADPRDLRSDFDDGGGMQRPSAQGFGRDQRDLYRPSHGGYDRTGDQDWPGAPQPGLSGPGRGDWRELYRGEGDPDSRGFGRSDYDMPLPYSERGYRERSDHGRRGYQGQRYDRLSGDRGYGSARNDRDFFDRAADEVASWFGDEEAERRRDQDYRGFGPRNCERSDARIQEDVNDALTADRHVDATEISVTVENCEVTLDGTVASRRAKRGAEDCAESVSGVRHVQNNLRVSRTTGSGSQDTATTIPS